MNCHKKFESSPSRRATKLKNTAFWCLSFKTKSDITASLCSAHRPAGAEEKDPGGRGGWQRFDKSVKMCYFLFSDIRSRISVFRK